MLFNFPKKRINDTTWFVTPTNLLIFGAVKLITMAISEEMCKTYYRLIDENDVEYTIGEEQIVDNNVLVPTPRYAIGDGVTYATYNNKGKNETQLGIIKHVEISFYEKDYIEITYTMEHSDSDDWVIEEEILGFGEIKTSSEYKSIETKEEDYIEYDHYKIRSSDV